jgi:hypothetical protein
MADDYFTKLSSPKHLRAVREKLTRQIEVLSRPPHDGRENWPHIVDRLQAAITEIDEILNAQGS